MSTRLPPLSLRRLRLHAQVQQPVQLPDHAGSMLRGAFGHALLQLACHCDGAGRDGHRDGCVYRAVFEANPGAMPAGLGNRPRPYVVEPPAWGARRLVRGDALDFSVLLLGPAIAHEPLILAAWRNALLHGLGGGTASFRSVQCEQDGVPEPGPVPNAVRLHFHTPLRLRRRGRVLDARHIGLRDLVLAVLRRVHALACLEPGAGWQPDYAGALELVDRISERRRLHWRDWGRYSQRQQREMRLGGLVGQWQLAGPLDAIWPLLYLGQWLHVGKNTTFGLGGYRLHPVSAGPRMDGELARLRNDADM